MTYSMCCHRPMQPAPVADLDVAGDRADPRVGEGLHQAVDRVRFDHGVGVDHDQQVVAGQRHARR